VSLPSDIRGVEGTPYASGDFVLSVILPSAYPFEPPAVRFLTPIYHPNIDNAGRICLDLLNSPPKGGWKPSINISTLLTSVQLLMSEPNPEDGLMADITEEYRSRRSLFLEKAMNLTRQHAVPGARKAKDDEGDSSGDSSSEEEDQERNESSSKRRKV
jgi:ubiquitin-conjugating enzyme E2 T